MTGPDLWLPESAPLPATRLKKRVGRWSTLAVLLGVVAIPIYGIYWLSESIALQPNIEKAGGSCQLEVVGPQWLKDFAGRDYVWLFGTPVSLGAPQRVKVDDRWLKRVRHMTALQSLSLCDSEITDHGMVSLVPLTKLESLDLSHTAVSDAGLEQIRGLTRLTHLGLAGTQITDDGLACLGDCHDMFMLDLAHTRVRGPGLKQLIDMQRLFWLNLDNTQLDDAGLSQLPPLPELKCLQLSERGSPMRA
jgi:hypothetical protein